MNLRQLRYFIAVAEDLNFGSAARRLHVAQPALSRQVRALEEVLGGDLFERDRRHVALTTLGAAFLHEARETVQRAQRALDLGQRTARGEVGAVTVGFSSASIFHPLIGDAVHAFRVTKPSITLSLEEFGMMGHFDAVRSGRADVSFIHLDPGDVEPRRRQETSLHLEVVARERLMLAVSQQHALATRDAVALSDIASLAFLALPSQLLLTAHGPFARLSALRGAPVHIAQEVRSVTAMIHLAAAGVGAAIVPRSMTCIYTPRIRYIPITGEQEVRSLLMLQPTNSSVAAQQFTHTVRDQLSRQGP